MAVPIDRVAQPSDNVPEDVERLLRSLPEWFGIEHSLLEYVQDSKRLPTYVVREPEDGAVVGVLLVRRHFPAAAEVHLMAVDRAWHRQGVGSALLHVAEAELRREGVRFLQVKTLSVLQVKTLSGSRIDENYDRTRRFYLAQGFTPLEEFPDLWDAGNPCLQLVKSL